MLRRLVSLLFLVLPATWGARLAYRLAAKPARLALRPEDKQTLEQAQRMQFGQQTELTAWSWGSGPVVVLLHGWGGRGAQMIPMAKAIAEQGFRAIVFDATAHGDGPPGRFSFRQLMLDAEQLSKALQEPIHGYIGHSAGGLALMLGAHQHRLQARHWICVCAPKYPYVPIQMIKKLLNPGERVLRLCRSFYAKEFKSTWDELKQGFLYTPKPGMQLLMIYDEVDKTVRHTDGDEILQQWPQAKLIKTQDLGHQKPLWEGSNLEEVVRFLLPSQSDSEAA